MYNDMIKEMIQRQQEYEFLKHTSASNFQLVQNDSKIQPLLQDKFLTHNVLPKIRSAAQKQKSQKFYQRIIKAIFILYTIFMVFVCILAIVGVF